MTSSNLKGCQKVAGGRSPRRPPEKVISHDRAQKGCQTSGQRKFTAKDLAPLRGAIQLISRIPGGLRGLRPPATFFATLRVAKVSQLYSYLCEPWVRLVGLPEPRGGDRELLNRVPLITGLTQGSQSLALGLTLTAAP